MENEPLTNAELAGSNCAQLVIATRITANVLKLA